MADTQTQPSTAQDKKVTLDLPMMSIQLHKPDMKLPHVPMPHISKQEMGHAVDVAKSILPPPERVAYYGALGALAVFGVVEWPVAAAIGVGTVIAQRARGNGNGKPTSARKPEKPKQNEMETRQKTASKAAEAATAKNKAAAVKNALTRQKEAVERTRPSK
ncbi:MULTISPECIES: hypothetical protein [Nonomuraea]|jgi:hypothetical protein|uniref:Uncharacterized protein n=1 Tax=Nonomuraea ferruginea TaxID=46174 RepID=A0ABT4TAZ4_9ACTN|nr:MULTISPECIES: hypothetical protein [Nonomuraea]MDA0646325.1 hypothetical protein [Nonomuraea ferruginea]TXK34951.1 hypothetical protein FR742_37305 [Nonomuraea sp. C10]